jgi:hypothetical protein
MIWLKNAGNLLYFAGNLKNITSCKERTFPRRARARGQGWKQWPIKAILGYMGKGRKGVEGWVSKGKSRECRE